MRYVSIWLLVGFVALFLLSMPEACAWLGVGFLSTLAFHALMLSVACEAAIGRINRVWFAVPLICYGAFFGLCAREGALIREEEARLESVNFGVHAWFDSNRDALQLDFELGTGDELLSRYKLPAFYQTAPETPENYVAKRLISHAQCDGVKKADVQLSRWQGNDSVFVTPANLSGVPFEQNPCILQLPEPLAAAPLHVTYEKEPAEADGRPIERKLLFKRGGVQLAVFRSASFKKMSASPFFFVGCFATDNGRYGCGADFDRRRVELADAPADASDDAPFSPIAYVLGLRPRSSQEIAAFRSAPDRGEALAAVKSFSERRKSLLADPDSLYFGRFVAFLNGDLDDFKYRIENPEQSALEHALAASQDRTAALAPQMVKRLAQMTSLEFYRGGSWLDLLLDTLVDLPRSAFARLSDDEVRELRDVVASPNLYFYRQSQELYLRLADAGARMLPVYEADLDEGRRLQAILGICRVGEAGPSRRRILETMYEGYARSCHPSRPGALVSCEEEVRSALYVTLLKLGEREFLEKLPLDFGSERIARWYAAVREGKGETEIGPNNCRALAYDPTRTPKPSPGLVEENGDWRDATGKR